MKTFIFLSFLYLLFSLSAFSQVVIPSSQSLGFEATEVGDTSWRVLDLFNPWPQAIDLEFHVPQKPGDNIFLNREGRFSARIEAGDSLSLRLAFIPQQNILSSNYLFITGNQPYGPVSIQLLGQGIFPNPYYAGTRDLFGEELLAALRDILAQNQETFSYNQGRDLIFMEVDNLKNYPGGPDSNALRCLYTGRTIGGYKDRREAQAMGFNTEHIWPQSLFDKKSPMKSDLHHIFPSDREANNRRSNYPFGPIDRIRWEKQGSRLGENQHFLPKRLSRGLVARSMFYFVARYENYEEFLNEQEGLLREWHLKYRPGDQEILRNEFVYRFQGNRNPFVDYPQLIYRIPTFTQQAIPKEPSLYVYPSYDPLNGISSSNSYPIFMLLLFNHGEEEVEVQIKGEEGFDFSSTFTLGTGQCMRLDVRTPEGKNLSLIRDQKLSYDATLGRFLYRMDLRPETMEEGEKESTQLPVKLKSRSRGGWKIKRKTNTEGLIQVYDLNGKLIRELAEDRKKMKWKGRKPFLLIWQEEGKSMALHSGF